jgi:hypothetical protein
MFLYPPSVVAAAASTGSDADDATVWGWPTADGRARGVEYAVAEAGKASVQAKSAEAAITVRERIEILPRASDLPEV